MQPPAAAVRRTSTSSLPSGSRAPIPVTIPDSPPVDDEEDSLYSADDLMFPDCLAHWGFDEDFVMMVRSDPARISETRFVKESLERFSKPQLLDMHQNIFSSTYSGNKPGLVKAILDHLVTLG